MEQTAWIVLSCVRCIAALDPYLSTPDGRRALHAAMGEAAALSWPHLWRNKTIRKSAAHLLVKNLSRISAGKDEAGNTRFVEGEFIEPVQLQVVCYQLWEALKSQPGDQIKLEDLERLARGQNLAEFIPAALILQVVKGNCGSGFPTSSSPKLARAASFIWASFILLAYQTLWCSFWKVSC
jgi:hypothetical protein